MSIRQIIYLILTFFAIAAFIVGISRYAKHSQPSNAADYSQCTEPTEIIGKGSGSIPSSPVRIIPDNGENDKSEQKNNTQELFDNKATCNDLKAQWSMADITHYAFWAGVAGVGLVFLTLLYTARGVFIAKDTARKQLRAYVSNSTVEFLINDTSDKAYGVIRYKNTGQTPAFDFKSTYRIEILDPRVSNAFAIDKAVFFGNQAKGILGKDGEFYSETARIDLSNSIIHDIKQGYLAVFVYGVCDYKDIYGKVRKTEFRRGWGNHFRNMHTIDMAICTEGNEMT